jgi:hypothetical protein
MYSLQVKIASFLFLLFTFFFISPSLLSVAYANRTCCTDAGGGAASGSCDYCRSSGIETKNFGDSCGGAANCQVCSASTPRSNECTPGGSGGAPGSNSAALCNYFGVNPAVATVQVGKSTTFTVSVQQSTWDYVNITNSNPSIAVTSPTQFAGKSIIGAPATYQYLYFNVTGLKIGSVYMSADQYATYPGYLFLYCSRGFTVNVIAASTPTPVPTVQPTTQPTATPVASTSPNACIPGARCDVVGNGRVQAGSSLSCSMPKAAAVTGLTSSYDLSCQYVNASGVNVGSPVTKSTTTVTAGRAVFASFAVTNADGKYKCAFRSCTTNSSGVKNCGAWGK